MNSTAIIPKFMAPFFCGFLSLAAACASMNLREVHPELKQAAADKNAWQLYEQLESYIARGTATEDDRRYAYETAKTLENTSAEQAFVRAALTGRLAELRGLQAIGLIKETESAARLSLSRDPQFRQGIARRLLGTLYVMAPASMLAHGDSETGLELLEKQVEEYPQDYENHVRLAEGYMHLSDKGSAVPFLCQAWQHSSELPLTTRRALETLVQGQGGIQALSCP